MRKLFYWKPKFFFFSFFLAPSFKYTFSKMLNPKNIWGILKTDFLKKVNQNLKTVFEEFYLHKMFYMLKDSQSDIVQISC